MDSVYGRSLLNRGRKSREAALQSLSFPSDIREGQIVQDTGHSDVIIEDPMDAELALRKSKTGTRVPLPEDASDRDATPDLGPLTIHMAKGRHSPPGRKRAAESALDVHRAKVPGHAETHEPHGSPEDHAQMPEVRLQNRRSTQDRRSGIGLPRKSMSRSPTWPNRRPSVDSSLAPEAGSVRNMKHPSDIPGISTSPKTPIKSPDPVQIPSQPEPGYLVLIESQKRDPRYPDLLMQPEARHITQEQLASEVKSIYAGLAIVETKCIQVDRAKAAALPGDISAGTELVPDHWQALIALHRTLLHEHHDFFLASQHPSASQALRRLPGKYSMPARMWRHGIHPFLELLRQRLPASKDFMLAFIIIAYQMVALLCETVDVFQNTWVECLGDLGRYRMAIEDEDARDRETWCNVSRSWYMKAADKNPDIGRLYHHLAVLARPVLLPQLYYYARAMTCVKPFPNARESVRTLFEPALARSTTSSGDPLPTDTVFVQLHGMLYGRTAMESFDARHASFLPQLDSHIGRITTKWKEPGVHVAITNIAALFNYGSDDSVLKDAFVQYGHSRAAGTNSSSTEGGRDEQKATPSSTAVYPSAELVDRLASLSNDETFSKAFHLTITVLSIVLRRIGDKNVLPHVHVMFSLFHTLASISYVLPLLDRAPWTDIAAFLNTLMKTERIPSLSPSTVFPRDTSDNLPLPEDYVMRGQIWSQWYFPAAWFSREHDEEDRNLELASTVKARMDRILQLGISLAGHGRWLSFQPETSTFTATAMEP